MCVCVFCLGVCAMMCKKWAQRTISNGPSFMEAVRPSLLERFFAKYEFTCRMVMAGCTWLFFWA